MRHLSIYVIRLVKSLTPTEANYQCHNILASSRLQPLHTYDRRLNRPPQFKAHTIRILYDSGEFALDRKP